MENDRFNSIDSDSVGFDDSMEGKEGGQLGRIVRKIRMKRRRRGSWISNEPLEPALPSSPRIRPVIAFVCSQEVLFGWHLFGNEETAAHLEGETNVFTS